MSGGIMARLRFGPQTWIWAVLLLAAVFYLAPIYVLVANGLKDSQSAVLAEMWRLPSDLSGGGFPQAWSRLSPFMQNSVIMVVPATILSSLLGAANGYLLSKWKFRGSDLLFTFMLFGFFIPYQAILVPLVRTLQTLGIYGTLPGLVVVHVIYGLPVTTLIFRNFFAGVPDELVKAARVDGAGIFRTFYRIMLPLSKPAFVVVAIFQFTNIWNDFLFGVTVVPNPSSQPVTVALNNLSGSYSIDWNVVMAGSVITALPPLLVYIFAGRYFISGLMAGSVKG